MDMKNILLTLIKTKVLIFKGGIFIETENNFKKPKAPIIGANGNVFNLIGICRHALKNAGYYDKVQEMTNRITSSKSYEDALSIMCEYIEPVGQNYDIYDDIDIEI